MAATNEALVKWEQLKYYDSKIKPYIDTKILASETSHEVDLKEVTASQGAYKSYQLTVGGTEIGTKIDIPKDQFIKTVKLVSAESANQYETGSAIGDKFLECVFAVEDDENDTIYVSLKDLMNTEWEYATNEDIDSLTWT